MVEPELTIKSWLRTNDILDSIFHVASCQRPLQGITNCRYSSWRTYGCGFQKQPFRHHDPKK